MARASNPTPSPGARYTRSMTWLFLACAKQPVAVESADRPATETGDSSYPSSESAQESDPHTGESAGAGVTVWEVDGPCGAWSGVQQTGTTWTYAASDAYVATYQLDGSFTTTATVGDAGIVTLATTGEYTGDRTSFQFSRTDTWRCDAAGAWWTTNESTSAYYVDGSGSTITGWRTFTPGWLVRPATADVGASWVDRFVLASEVNGIRDEGVDTSCVSIVSNEEKRNIEAGEFLARKIDTDCDVSTDSSRWLTQFLGMIETDDEILVEYVP